MIRKKHKDCGGHNWVDHDYRHRRAQTQCEYCHVKLEEWAEFCEAHMEAKTLIKHTGGRPPKPASERAAAVVHVRVTAARKAAYVAAAKARGMSISKWVQEQLDEELEKWDSPW